MAEQEEILTCTHCGESYEKGVLQRDCSNCFACTGCEIYICPNCRKDIVVKPIKNTFGKK